MCAFQVKPVTVTAPGDARNTGAPGFTPGPTRPVPPLDLGIRSDEGGGQRYGRNQAFHAASIEPGTKLTSDFSVQPDDPVLQSVIGSGAARNTTVGDLMSPQTRPISAEPIPTSFGMKGASSGPKIPGSVDKSGGPLPGTIRKP
jgi:hypothetical protein